MKVVLISTYDLGRQPLGLASPAAWLRERGHTVACVDLSVGALPSLVIRESDAVAFYLPMHTATRLAVDAIAKVRLLNPRARLLAYGLYAPLNADLLGGLGVTSAIGGEYESLLCEAIETPLGSQIGLDRLPFLQPDRTTLPVLGRYAKLHAGGAAHKVAYTEASRGCKHLCRHCPIVPVYQGRFRVIPPEIVIEDIRRQVAQGAAHVTFGDPDFLNGPAHALRILERFASEFPGLTYDITAKVEHLLRHRALLPLLKETGCLFVTSAVESLDDRVLEKLDKGHTRADFEETVRLFRQSRLALAPTFIPFTPWTDRDSYLDLLDAIARLDLVANVAPIQLALRLLIPSGSRLLELDDIRKVETGFDRAALLHRWRHADPAIDALAARVLGVVTAGSKESLSRQQMFARVWDAAVGRPLPEDYNLLPRAAIPYMDEPWYC